MKERWRRAPFGARGIGLLDGSSREPALVPHVYSCPYRDCERLNLIEVPGEIVAVRPRV